jgi:hypothetical protein
MSRRRSLQQKLETEQSDFEARALPLLTAIAGGGWTLGLLFGPTNHHALPKARFNPDLPELLAQARRVVELRRVLGLSATSLADAFVAGVDDFARPRGLGAVVPSGAAVARRILSEWRPEKKW